MRDLEAAGITHPALAASYERCRRLHAAYGRTYYLATYLLPPEKRPYVDALYGFARYADELVDTTGVDPDRRASRFEQWSTRFLVDLAAGRTTDPVTAAVLHTAATWNIPPEHFASFLDSMRMDLTVTSYATYADLERYMYGSAAVIGLEMAPILGPLPGLTEPAAERAAHLGRAFQLTNFLRDVREDAVRGRVYLPQEDLERFGVRRSALTGRHTTPEIRRLVAFEVRRARGLYDAAAPGIGMLEPSSRECVRTAFVLYQGILDQIERSGCRVLERRATVPMPVRLRVALPAYRRARRGWSTPSPTEHPEDDAAGSGPNGLRH